MASVTLDVSIANKGRRSMAKRNLSKKQIAAGFGGKRRQSAAKSARRSKRNRAKPAAKKHRPRSTSNPARKSRPAAATHRPRKRNESKGQKRVRIALTKYVKRRRNVGGIFALTNPAEGGRKKVARKAKSKKTQRNSAGKGGKRYSRPRKKNKGYRRSRKNPGVFGSPMDWASLGAGAIVGSVGATSLPQMALGPNNSGPMGYVGMAAATAILAVGVHLVFKKNTMLTAGTIAGGAGALIKRVLGDYTPLGQYLGQSGMGDYLSNFNFPVPQQIGGNGNVSLGAPGTIPVSVAGAGMSAAGLTGRPLY